VERTADYCFRAPFQSWVGGLLVAGAAFAASACSDAHDPAANTVSDTVSGSQQVQAGSVEGEFVSYIADFEDGHSERSYAVRLSDGRELPLSLDTPPSVVTGARVRVQGRMVTGDALRARGGAIAEAFQATRVEPMVAQTLESAPVTYASPPSPDTYALVLVDLGAGVDVDAGAGQTTMFSTTPAAKSFASFYYESSYGKYSVTGAVVGPYTFSMTTCDTTGMASAIEAQIPTTYNHYIYYFKRSTLCTFGGLGEEGSVNRPAKRTWMNGSLTCVVLMQEPGHNLGLMHANTITCGTASFSTTPGTSCTITEYGSGLTPMGSGCHQLNGYEKWYEQWLTGCNGVRVTSSGTFNLVPLGESCPGAVQVLQVPMPATLAVNDPQATTTTVNLKDYYVELRAAAGTFDQYSAAGRGGGVGGGVTYSAPTVYVYVSDDVHPGTTTGRGGGGSSSVWTELLNMSPGATPFTGLTTVGQSFKDPAGGATITLESISASGAVVGVTVANGTGGPTCIDGTTMTGSGSDCDGGAVTIPPFDAGTIAEAGTSDDAGQRSEAGGVTAMEAGPAAEGGQGGAQDAGADSSGGSYGGRGDSAVADASEGQPGSGMGSPSIDAGDFVWGLGAGKAAGCGCETVGARAQGRGEMWTGVGALALMGWGAHRRKARRATRQDAPKSE
jgi:hypothetical protein